jgi:hypothetical protein
MARDPALDPSGLARATERLANLIPGYSGYKERERLREEDRAVRASIARNLGIVMGRMERALKQVARNLPPGELEEADEILRALGRHRDRIRFAPGGYASLFARNGIDAPELDGLVTLDAGLYAVLEELDRLAGGWDQDSRNGDPGWPGKELTEALFELERVLDERESFLRS